ncbi:MAG: hypothetical protein GX977_00165 [Firmicutes bacterium]|jgi:tight adherence protein B|nr:hypothetical protein [Bacillota bacterium]
MPSFHMLRLAIVSVYFSSFLFLGLSLRKLDSRWVRQINTLRLKEMAGYLAGHLGCRGLVGAVLGWLLANYWGSLCGAVLLSLVPLVIGTERRRREQARLEMQLLDGLSLMQGGLRAGFNLFQVLELVAREMEPPLATIANRISSEVRLGVPMDTAWERAGAEVSNKTFSELVTAVTIQRQMGGDLGFILGTLRESLRQRINLQAKLKSVTSQGRLTGIVISVLPVALAGVIHLVMPQFIEPLFVNPWGQVLLGVAFSLEVVGAWMINRICRIDP